MQNQGEYQQSQKVREAVLNPMMRLYQPPSHVRTDKEAFNALIAEYAKALGGFTKPTLEMAWETVKDEHSTWIWPHLKVLKDACIRHAPAERKLADNNTDFKKNLQQRADDAYELARKYLAEYELSPLMLQAKTEGWADDLRRYVTAAARSLADVITRLKNWGYLWPVYQWESRMANPDVIKQRRKDFEEFVYRQAATGQMEIEVPAEAIEIWKRRVKAA